MLRQVMVSTSGSQLLPNAAVTNLRQHILPLTTVLTPNIPEAKLLLQNSGSDPPEIDSIDDIVRIATLLSGLGPKYVLVKGGHLPLAKDGKISHTAADRHSVIDVLYSRGDEEVSVFETDHVKSNNTHGTGCSLACTSPLVTY